MERLVLPLEPFELFYNAKISKRDKNGVLRTLLQLEMILKMLYIGPPKK